jgi:hypothetical protein
VLVARNRQDLSKPDEHLRRRIVMPNRPNRCRGVKKLKRNEKLNAYSYKKRETVGGMSKKSIEYEGNGSERNENWKRSRNASVVSELEKNASKSGCGVERGMRRSSASENSAEPSSKRG